MRRDYDAVNPYADAQINIVFLEHVFEDIASGMAAPSHVAELQLVFCGGIGDADPPVTEPWGLDCHLNTSQR